MFSPPRSASNSSYLPVPTFNKEDIQFVHNTEIEGKNFTFYFWQKRVKYQFMCGVKRFSDLPNQRFRLDKISYLCTFKSSSPRNDQNLYFL